MAAAWQTEFQCGVKAYQSADYPQALELLSQAILHGANRVMVYDSRAAVYEKLGKTKEALKDTKTCVELDRTAFQGYVRATRLFLKLGNHGKASAMVSAAFRHVDLSHPKRRLTLEDLEKQAADMSHNASQLAAKNQCQISKLPLELLMEILTLSTGENDHGDASHLKLASVCSQWSNIIHNRTHFWSSLTLTQFRPCAKVDLWMRHAGGRIEELTLTHGLGIAKCDSALDLLGSECRDHITSITIHSSSHVAAFRSRRNILYLPNKISHLKVTVPPGQVTPFHYALILEEKPELEHYSLQKLAFRGIHSSDLSFLTHTMLPTLTDLTLEGCLLTLSRLSDMLRIQSSLSSLTLVDSAWRERTRSLPDSRHTLTHLRQLSVDGPDILDHICSHFDLVDIHTLILAGQVKPVESYLVQIVTEQTAKSMEVLKIRRCHFNGTRLAESVAQMENLRSLYITNSGSDVNAVVQKLSSKEPSTSACCPLLTHVNLSGCIQLRAEPCVRLIRSRSPSSMEDQNLSPGADAVIKLLHIDNCPDLDADLVSWLRLKVPQFSANTARENRKRKR